VAFCDLPGLLSALLDEDLLALLLLNASNAVLAEVLVSLAWAISISATGLDEVFAELFIVSLNLDSQPLLGVLAIAQPVVQADVVLVFVVSGREASL
jgi:hypothetical protein